MIGLGTIVNVLAIIIGGAAGMLLKKLLSSRLTDMIMQGLGLAVVIIGLRGALEPDAGGYTMIMIASLAVGALVGELIGIEDKLAAFAGFCEKKFVKQNGTSTFAQGFVTATLVFCVGAMAIVGSLEDGINRNTDILFAKSALDAIAGMVFASAMGAGVIFSIFPLMVYQGSITLLAVFVAPYLNTEVIGQMSLVGSVLIVGIGLNMLKIAKIKVGNLLPAIFVPVVYYIVSGLFH